LTEAHDATPLTAYLERPIAMALSYWL
jgi:hypothetical protein